MSRLFLWHGKEGTVFMMDYEMFRDVVKEKFLSYMPGKYQDMEVRVVPVEKVNRKLDGLRSFRMRQGRWMKCLCRHRRHRKWI